MSVKEWILLVAPIIANGIFVYFFQYAVSIHIEKKARLQRNRYKMLEELQQQLTDLYNACKAFVDSLNARYENNVGSTFNQEILCYKEVKLFYLMHKKMLPKYIGEAEQIYHEIENVHREMIRIQTDYDGIISSATVVTMMEHHNKLVEILEQTIDSCCRELNEIYT